MPEAKSCAEFALEAETGHAHDRLLAKASAITCREWSCAGSGADGEVQRAAHHCVRSIQLILGTPNVAPGRVPAVEGGFQAKPQATSNAVEVIALVQRAIRVERRRQHAHSPTITRDVLSTEPTKSGRPALRRQKNRKLPAGVFKRDWFWSVHARQSPVLARAARSRRARLGPRGPMATLHPGFERHAGSRPPPLRLVVRLGV